MRSARVERRTRETEVLVELSLDGSGAYEVEVDQPFLKHMLETLSRHSLFDLKLSARGDLRHHVVEDVAIALGEALRRAIGGGEGISRYGFAYAPMDGSLARAVVDVSGRGFSAVSLKLSGGEVEGLRGEELEHFLRSLAYSAGITLHVEVLYGDDDHHKAEAAFKALAMALRRAVEVDPRVRGALSVKGSLL